MTRTGLVSVAIACATAIACTALVVAGPLDPPAGAVAPTHKTLSEVEPRIAINQTNTPGDATSVFRITQRGSYYLTGNVSVPSGKHGVVIAASDVTLDLGGFTILGPGPGSTLHDGVSVEGVLTQVTVRHGSIRAMGGYGVKLYVFPGNPGASNSRVEAVNASGCRLSGIIVGESSVVVDCIATANQASGIFAYNACVIEGCTASQNDANGIEALERSVLARCTSIDNTQNGFRLQAECAASQCIASGNDLAGFDALHAARLADCESTSNQTGFSVGTDGIITGCVARLNTGHGIRMGQHAVATGNTSSDNAVGIHVSGTANLVQSNNVVSCTQGILLLASARYNRIDGNSCVSNGTGFDIDGTDNLIVRNTASNSTGANYSIVAGNSVAPRVAVVASDGWAGISNANHPWANLGY